MTVRDLRRLLFEIENQNLSVRDVRARLFHVEDQDTPMDVRDIARLIGVLG
jgi:hypothetical protein